MNKASFDAVPELYDSVRPTYPEETIQAIIKHSGIPTGGRILEVGPGTGQITQPLADRGYEILALELGPNLAAYAQTKFAAYPNVQILNTAFEAWEPELKAFDLFVSAQAFHWIDPDFGLTTAYQALRTGASMALVWHLDVSQDSAFYKATTPIFERYVNQVEDKKRPQPDSGFQKSVAALQASPLFTGLIQESWDWQRTYSKEAFIGLLNTFSPQLSLSESVRRVFNEQMAKAIDTFGGVVPRSYRTVLVLAQTCDNESDSNTHKSMSK